MEQQHQDDGEGTDAVESGLVWELLAHDALPPSGTLEIVPPAAPLVLFVWSAQRVVPVRLPELVATSR